MAKVTELMTPNEFRTRVLVKLEMLRGCCNTSSIKKAQIADSIQRFSKEISDVKFDYSLCHARQTDLGEESDTATGLNA